MRLHEKPKPTQLPSTRFLPLLLLSTFGLFGSIWNLGSLLCDDCRCPLRGHTNKPNDIKIEKRTYEGKRLFQNYQESLPPNRPISTREKWAVITVLPGQDMSAQNLRILQDSKPNDSWSVVLVVPEKEQQRLRGLSDDNDTLHVISLGDFAGEHRFGHLVKELRKSSIHETAFRNLGYLYALQQGARYILDLELGPDLKESWPNLEKTMFSIDTELAVDVPLVGDTNIFNPHSFFFKDSALGSSWPRGYPKRHNNPRQPSTIAFRKEVNRDRIGVVQQISHAPDLDSTGMIMAGGNMHHMDEKGAMSNKYPLLVPRHVSVPYNAKATLHTPNTLWATLLPTTLSPRVADIWHAYISQALFQSTQTHVVLLPPPKMATAKEGQYQTIKSSGHAQMITEKELEEDLVHYRRTPDLLRVLEDYQLNSTTIVSLPEKMEDLWIHLYENGFLQIDDVVVLQLWLEALTKENLSEIPELQPKIYFDNVVFMGQFNYATLPKALTTELTTGVAEQLALRLADTQSFPQEDSSRMTDLVIRQEMTAMVAFWTQKWREVFRHVVVRGPFSQQQVMDLRMLYGIEAHGMEDSRWEHTKNDEGYYSPISNLMLTLQDYKEQPGIEGVLYAHDDMFIDVASIAKENSANDSFGTKFPSNSILASGQRDRESFFDPRAKADELLVVRRAYSIDSHGNFSTLDGRNFGSDQGALEQALESWPWNREYCIPRLAELAKDSRIDPFREKEGKFAGSILIPPMEPADFLFVPTRFADKFSEVASIFLDHKVFLECAAPTIVDILRKEAGATVQTTKLCTSWGRATRGTEAMIRGCREEFTHGQGDNSNKDNPWLQRSFGLYHPFKLSKGIKLWDEVFDTVTFGH